MVIIHLTIQSSAKKGPATEADTIWRPILLNYLGTLESKKKLPFCLGTYLGIIYTGESLNSMTICLKLFWQYLKQHCLWSEYTYTRVLVAKNLHYCKASKVLLSIKLAHDSTVKKKLHKHLLKKKGLIHDCKQAKRDFKLRLKHLQTGQN